MSNFCFDTIFDPKSNQTICLDGPVMFWVHAIENQNFWFGSERTLLDSAFLAVIFFFFIALSFTANTTISILVLVRFEDKQTNQKKERQKKKISIFFLKKKKDERRSHCVLDLPHSSFLQQCSLRL